MANEHTAERLMQWGADCNRENNGGLGLALVQYAEAWQQERDALRAENKRLKAETGQYGEWPTHDSHHPPADLAPAQLVYWNVVKGESMLFMGCDTAEEAPWQPGLCYRPALSADGEHLCSAEGLDPCATHVCVLNDKNPYCLLDDGQALDIISVAPETHRKPGPASESLMEVWRD